MEKRVFFNSLSTVYICTTVQSFNAIIIFGQSLIFFIFFFMKYNNGHTYGTCSYFIVFPLFYALPIKVHAVF